MRDMGIQEKFTARSGRTVTGGDDGSLMFGKAIGYLSREAAFDAEEYFEAKRDAELGRWRWPANPHIVVYPQECGDFVHAIDERTAKQGSVSCDRSTRFGLGVFHDAAAAYFEAHPVVRPWHDAKPGEVWVLTVPDEGDVETEIVTVATTYGTFTAGSTAEWSRNDAQIITARQVPTEVAS